MSPLRSNEMKKNVFLLMKALVLRRLQLLGNHAVSDAAVEAALMEASRGTSLARATGVSLFGDAVVETENVLCPRADSEVLVELAAQRCNRAARVCDLGTGSAALLIWLLQLRPDLCGVGIDLCPNAVATAKRNVRRNGVNAEILHLDWNLQPIPFHQPFDMALWNPPYVRTEDCASISDPLMALDGGLDGLNCYRKVPWHYVKQGCLFVFKSWVSV